MEGGATSKRTHMASAQGCLRAWWWLPQSEPSKRGWEAAPKTKATASLHSVCEWHLITSATFYSIWPNEPYSIYGSYNHHITLRPMTNSGLKIPSVKNKTKKQSSCSRKPGSQNTVSTAVSAIAFRHLSENHLEMPPCCSPWSHSSPEGNECLVTETKQEPERKIFQFHPAIFTSQGILDVWNLSVEAKESGR